MKRLIAIAFTLLALIAGSGLAMAQSPPAEAPSPETKDKDNGALIRELIERLERVEKELARLKARKNGAPPADAAKKDQKVLTLLETPYFGTSHYGSNQSRFFAARLIFINLKSAPVTIQREDVELAADGKAYKLGDVPTNVQYQSFQVGNESFTLRNLSPAKELTVAPGGTASTWAVFTGLPRGTDVPKLVLKMNLGGEPSDLDANEFSLGLLGMKVEQIGPRKSLGLISLSGSLNTINMQALIDALDELTRRKVARAVIRWTDTAAPLDSHLLNWLQQAVQQAGRGDAAGDSRYPVIPAAVRDLHLAAIPNQRESSSPSSSSRSSNSGPPRIHKTDVEAIAAALATAYEILPRDELWDEIENGHPATRAAALANGGGRLPAERLPAVLEFADGNDPQLQRAALTALRHFGEKPAIEELIHYARKGAEPLASAAVESLAASRYAAAHAALLEILKNEPPQSRKLIVRILARYPRPIWSETIYEYVGDSDPQVAVEALRALTVVGHPKLVETLTDSLGNGAAPVRDESFRQLAMRTDPRSEQIALDHALERLKDAPPDPLISTLLTRTKDRRAIPLLLEHLDKSPGARSIVIGSLAQIGDQSAVEKLVELYPKLQDQEKRTVLSALAQLRSPEFRKLAGEALLTRDSSLINAAVDGLRQDGSVEAVGILISAYGKTNYSSALSYISNALGTLGTPEARAALQKARQSTDDNKRRYAVSALQRIRSRSPGYQFIYQARELSKQEKWDEAAEQYGLAVRVDPELPDGYAGRGHAHLKRNKVADAKKDLSKALQLDPYNSLAVTGLAVCQVLEGKLDEGIKLVEENRSKFTNEAMFAYNAACVYGRALEHVRKDEKAADREKHLDEYRGKALAELQRAVKLGYRDFGAMKKDPDLNSLHEAAEFKEIVGPAGSGKQPVPNDE